MSRTITITDEAKEPLSLQISVSNLLDTYSVDAVMPVEQVVIICGPGGSTTIAK